MRSFATWPLCACILACACTRPGDSDSKVDDTGSASDDTGSASDDTGTTLERPPWADQPWYDVALFPHDAGLTWEIEDDWYYEDVTVPAVLVAPDGTFRMYLSIMNDDDYGTVGMVRSDDGVDWSSDPEVLLTSDDFSADCGYRLTDSAVIYLDDGTYRLLVEGLREDSGSRVFCSAISEDGDNWTTEDGVAYEPAESDYGTISVPEVLRVHDGRWLLFYLGDIMGAAGPDMGDGVRLAISEDGKKFESATDTNLLPSHDTDPFPVLLDNGRLRVHHTHPVMVGRIARSETDDGLTYDESEMLDGLGLEVKSGELFLDPVALHLPDDRLVMYFTRILMDEEGAASFAAIGRAWATDYPPSAAR